MSKVVSTKGVVGLIKGDTVTCINGCLYFTKGKVYTVLKVNSAGEPQTVDDEGDTIFMSAVRFESKKGVSKVSTRGLVGLTKGDEIVCIKGCEYFTLYRVYVVSDILRCGSARVIDDLGHDLFVSSDRFSKPSEVSAPDEPFAINNGRDAVYYTGYMQKTKDDTKPSGGSSNSYYTVEVKHPLKDSRPYNAECYDIIKALGLSWDEANAFKAIWRSAAARQGNGKVGTDAIYDAEKVAFHGKRMVEDLK